MYNSIYPYNINYQKQNHYQKPDSEKQAAKNPKQEINNQNQNNPNTFPNGTKVAIDYSKGQINISQVLADFRSTIIAINAPQDVQEEVSLYLNLVEKESLKENPSREIILSNLKNASKVSDDFITKSLKKPSNVVEGWIKALFLQNINIKSDPSFINPDFALSFPQKAQERIDNAKNANQPQIQQPQAQQQPQIQQLNEPQQFQSQTIQTQQSTQQFQGQLETVQESRNNEIKFSNDDKFEIESEIELSSDNQIQQQSYLQDSIQLQSQAESQSILYSDSQSQLKTYSTTQVKNLAFGAVNEIDRQAKEIFAKAKVLPKTSQGSAQALNLLNEALGIISNNENANENIKAAIHIERGKIFDSYDYVDYALRDYYEATKASELNLKAQAFYKTGQIYDEFNEFDPALDNYLSSVAYSGEAANARAQSQVLTKIASLYTKQFNIEQTSQYQNLALDLAIDTNNEDLIAKTYSQGAQNYQYLGENDRAIDNYKNALAVFSRKNESFEEMAYNYEQAAKTMLELGNPAKAAKLQLKANQYYQKAQLENDPQAKAS